MIGHRGCQDAEKVRNEGHYVEVEWAGEELTLPTSLTSRCFVPLLEWIHVDLFWETSSMVS